MTTDDTESAADAKEDTANTNPTSTSNLAGEIMDIMEHLSLNKKIVFKSQQRNEPELQQSEKIKLAQDIYNRNPQTFLIRFGHYMEEKHLDDFERLSIADSDEEMHSMINDYREKLKTRQRDVKNRRYAALQNLIKEGEYFSEQEMMKRSPELYHELVGQYLSKEEKLARDSYDVRNTTFSGILMHTLEQKSLSDIMEKAEENVNKNNNRPPVEKLGPAEDYGQDEKELTDELYKEFDEVPANCRQQWGNFDNEQVACSSSKIEKPKISNKSKALQQPLKDMITADERELLRQEFVSQMHEQFLSGKDDEFDYSTVDDNTQLDNLEILNQDKEDKYFDESDPDSDAEETMQKAVGKNEMDNEESEDELDVFMNHLNKHHSLQK